MSDPKPIDRPGATSLGYSADGSETVLMETHISSLDSKNLGGGLGMSLVFRPGSVSQTVDALAMARNVAQIHQQELTIAVDDAHQKQGVLDEALSNAQSQRLASGEVLKNTDNAPAGERAAALLNLQNAAAEEIRAKIAAEENAVKYIEADIMLNNGRIWWPDSDEDVRHAREYIAKREADKASTNQLIGSDKNDLSVVTAMAETTKQDIERIKHGEVIEKYRPENEKAAEAEARAKADAEAKAKADAEAKAKADRDALFAKAGVRPAPVYTAEMVKAASGALSSAGILPMGSTPGGVQLAVAGGGSFALPVADGKGILDAIVNSVSALGKRTPVGFVISAIFHSPKAGEGSDKVPGRDVPALFAFPASAVAGAQAIEAGLKTVDLPVRGKLVLSNGELALQLLKTGEGVPKPVPVLTAVRDTATGLDKITVPAVAGAPSRTILINPAQAPSAPSNTGTPPPAVPVTPVHTGTEVKAVDTITVTTPVADHNGLQDFIYWRPDAAGTGVEPVYVVLSGPYGETNAKGKYSGRDYNTDKAGGPIQDLDWRTAAIDRAGVDNVKLHTGRFGASADNAVMIDRLEKILKGELQPTDIDKRFYTHEIRELERYRNLGVKDGERPKNRSEVWNNTHTATLEDYKINEKTQPLYTPEAEEAYRKAEEGK